MSRIKRGKRHLKRRKKLLKQVKGYRWGRKNLIKLAKVAMLKAGVYAYRDRRTRKRQFRRLWQIRINAAVREQGLNYSQFAHALKKNKIEIDRKILADLAQHNPEILKVIIGKVKG